VRSGGWGTDLGNDLNRGIVSEGIPSEGLGVRVRRCQCVL